MATKGKRLIFSGAMTLPAREANALDSDIKPGMSVAFAATGVDKNAEASTVFGTPLYIADKAMLSAGTVDDTYATGANVIARQLASGECANVRVAVANLTKQGMGLTSNGDGTMKNAATDGTDYITCYSDEIINVTVAGTLVRVRGA